MVKIATFVGLNFHHLSLTLHNVKKSLVTYSMASYFKKCSIQSRFENGTTLTPPFLKKKKKYLYFIEK